MTGVACRLCWNSLAVWISRRWCRIDLPLPFKLSWTSCICKDCDCMIVLTRQYWPLAFRRQSETSRRNRTDNCFSATKRIVPFWDHFICKSKGAWGQYGFSTCVLYRYYVVVVTGSACGVDTARVNAQVHHWVFIYSFCMYAWMYPRPCWPAVHLSHSLCAVL